MVRFVGQRDEYACGAIAVLNAAKFFGLPMTGRDMGYLKRLCRTGPPPGGTWPSDMEKGLRRVLGTHVRIGRRTGRGRPKNAREFLREVRAADAAIVLFGRGRRRVAKEGHYLLVIPEGPTAKVVNPWPKDRTVRTMSWQRFGRKFGRRMGWAQENGRIRVKYPQVWIMKRRRRVPGVRDRF